MVGRAGDPTDAVGRIRLNNAVLAALREGEPRLIVLEDVHWADKGQSTCSAPWPSAAGRCRVAVVATARGDPTEMQPGVAARLAPLPTNVVRLTGGACPGRGAPGKRCGCYEVRVLRGPGVTECGCR